MSVRRKMTTTTLVLAFLLGTAMLSVSAQVKDDEYGQSLPRSNTNHNANGGGGGGGDNTYNKNDKRDYYAGGSGGGKKGNAYYGVGGGGGKCECTAYLGYVWQELSYYINLEDICCMIGADIYYDYYYYKYYYYSKQGGGYGGYGGGSSGHSYRRGLSEEKRRDELIKSLDMTDEEMKDFAKRLRKLEEGEQDEAEKKDEDNGETEPKIESLPGRGSSLHGCYYDAYYPQRYVGCLMKYYHYQAIQACYCHYRTERNCNYEKHCTKTLDIDIYVADGPYNACKQCPDGKEYLYGGRYYQHQNSGGYKEESGGRYVPAGSLGGYGGGGRNDYGHHGSVPHGHFGPDGKNDGYGHAYGSGSYGAVDYKYEYERGSPFDRCLGYCLIAEAYYYKYYYDYYLQGQQSYGGGGGGKSYKETSAGGENMAENP